MSSKYFLYYIPVANSGYSFYTVQCAEPFLLVAALDSNTSQLVLPDSSSTEHLAPGGIAGLPYVCGLGRSASSNERVSCSFGGAPIVKILVATLSAEPPNAKVGVIA